MLNILRKKGVAKKILWVVAIVIIISFGFFGRASMLRDSHLSNYAGKIFNQKISIQDFEKIYKHNYIQAMIRYGESFPKVRQMLNLESETWDRLILLHEAKKRKIKVTDDEVITEISETPFFQRNNQFDTLLYNDILRRYFFMSPREYEESIRDSIKISKLYDLETDNVNITDEELFDAYRLENEKVQISYILVSPDPFKNQVTFTEDEKKDYYQKNKIEFLKPSMINVEYIRLPFPKKELKDAATEEKGSEEESSENTEKNTADEETETDRQKQNILAESIEIYQELSADSDMATIAKKHNVDLKTTGLFNAENPNLNIGWTYAMFKDIFEMAVGEISQPLETDQAVFIIKIKEKKEAYIPEYSEAQEEIEKAVITAKSKEMARDKAEKILNQLKEKLALTKVKDFPQAAKDLGLTIYQTPIFARKQYLPVVGLSKEFQEEAFSLTDENPISDVIEIEKGFSILHLDKYIPADKEAFEAEKNIISQQLLVEKKMKIFNNLLTNLRIKARLEDNISKLRGKQQEEQ